MTNMPEAKLAREAEICYATVAMVTDYDCWHPDHDAVTVDMIVGVLLANAQKGEGAGPPRSCRCSPAMPGRAGKAASGRSTRALITAPDKRDPALLARLDAVAGRVLRGALMNVRGRPMRTIWLAGDGRTVEIIDQTPAASRIGDRPARDARARRPRAIRTMQVRGAPLIGVAAAYGVALAMADRSFRSRARPCRRDAGRDPPDRGQFALGVDRNGRRAALAAAAGAALRPLSPAPPRLPRRMSRAAARSASTARA